NHWPNSLSEVKVVGIPNATPVRLSLQSCTTREIKRRMCDGRKPESQHSRMILESWLTTLKAIRAAIAAIASRHS
ncbi:TPA: hypothetical protein ACPHWI_004836, partial [Pseudomonas aeruginosa]